MNPRRLQSQLRFVRQVDRLKLVLRKGKIISGGRLENSAEHSWHLAVMVMVLHEHSKIRINVAKAVQLAIIHDLAEILVGDTFVYDKAGRARKLVQEPRAAARLFGQLPRDQGSTLLRLWLECEKGTSPEARFVKAVDRLEPLMGNYFNRGYSWKKFGINARQVNEINAKWKSDAPRLGDYADRLIAGSVKRGYLKPH